MVPHWTAPNALMLGNAVILKPSEHVPLSAIRMKEMLLKAGLPKGLFQTVLGGKSMVELLCENPTIKLVLKLYHHPPHICISDVESNKT